MKLPALKNGGVMLSTSGDGKIPSQIRQNEIISQFGQHKAIDRI